ncbi:MAG: hypothetical protein U9O96_08340 [Candidatus Thermoplasmatota archaeon]|nr:hypothetical protein [Candidatus Thermoplasmatota archaeon]
MNDLNHLTDEFLDMHWEAFAEKGKLSTLGANILFVLTLFDPDNPQPAYPFGKQSKEIQRQIIKMLWTNKPAKKLLQEVLKMSESEK